MCTRRLVWEIPSAVARRSTFREARTKKAWSGITTTAGDRASAEVPYSADAGHGRSWNTETHGLWRGRRNRANGLFDRYFPDGSVCQPCLHTCAVGSLSHRPSCAPFSPRRLGQIHEASALWHKTGPSLAMNSAIAVHLRYSIALRRALGISACEECRQREAARNRHRA